jgi:dynein assembly factor 5, axonemal
MQALSATALCAQAEQLEEIFDMLQKSAVDDHPSVRSATVSAAGVLMTQLKDRYSYFHRSVPLALTAFTDDIPDVAALARSVMNRAGELYETENQDQVKDYNDFVAFQDSPGE